MSHQLSWPLSSLPDFVDTIGYSPNTERKQLNKVVDMVGEGVLEATVIQYNPDENLPIQEVRSVSESGRQNESDDHLRLKAIAAQYLSKCGRTPVYEQHTWYGVADVGTEDLSKAVECGSVRAGKLIEAFGFESSLAMLGESNPAYGCLDELLYIPYTSNENYPPVTILSLSVV